MNAHTNPRREYFLAQPLPADRRSALRTALKNTPAWEAYRFPRGLTLDAMGKTELIDAALSLDLPLAPFFPGASAAADAADDGERHKPRPYGREQVNELTARFCAAHDEIHEKQRAFCRAVLKTIEDNQDGRATEKQYATLARIIARAERRAADPAADHSTSTSATSGDAFTRTRATTATTTPPTVTAPTVTAAPAAADPAHQLAGLIAQLAGQSINPEQVARIVDERITAALSGMPSVHIECKGPDGKTRAVDGHQHPQFKNLLRAATSRMTDNHHPNIWLAGPAGSGKTYAAKQVAHAMGLSLHMNGALANAFELLGFIDAAGAYHRTAFRDAFELGGVYMFDEVDGSDNSALLALNAALANGSAQFPDARIDRHPDCIILASANTWGLGATADYVGRSKIDAAFLDRFGVRLSWDYDAALEIAISGNEAFARRVQMARSRARDAGLKALITPRASQAGAALIAAGMTPDDAAELTYLANLTPDQRRIVEGR